MSSEARFDPDTTGYLYSRYKRFGDDTMDESFFPITWREDGYRSPFLDDYLAERVGWAGARPPARARPHVGGRAPTRSSADGALLERL